MPYPNADPIAVRPGLASDAETIGRLLHEFNAEFGERTPGPEALAARVRELIRLDDVAILLSGEPTDGLAVLRFRPAIWTDALECHLAELYVAPSQRGNGTGRALMNAAIELARRKGADHMDIGVDEPDVVARRLYESLGFSNRANGPDGPVSYFYERVL